MKTPSAVEVILDLRQYSERVEGASGFINLWRALAPALEGQRLDAGRSYNVADPERGKVGITLVNVPPDHSICRPETPFAIHSVLEPSIVYYACATCKQEGRRQYGPFVCQPCRDEHKETRLCDEHVVILNGSMASFCVRHRPVSPSGEPATFWCAGPQCRRRQVAWGPSDQRAHPNDPDYLYCAGCYAEMFPRCDAAPNCEETGSNSCEFVDPASERGCGVRLCNRHVRRWQIYGPHRLGLSLCPAHRRTSSLSDAQVAYEVVAGSAMRRGNAWRLPTLGSVRHILQNARGRFYELPAIQELFRSLARSYSGNTRLQSEMVRMIREREPLWQREIDGNRDKQRNGMVYFEQLKAAYRAKGLERVAEGLIYSDYKERGENRLLIVDLDASLKGLFIGRQGVTKKEIEARLGVRVKLEELSRT
ncbi:MAG TPA: KH domain-containing protein [Pyrinomonadaceae bacterium]|nr:KH domain-containing protein [Pyrinomonadaceae bacterium]